jgi:hypothetical protein
MLSVGPNDNRFEYLLAAAKRRRLRAIAILLLAR